MMAGCDFISVGSIKDRRSLSSPESAGFQSVATEHPTLWTTLDKHLKPGTRKSWFGLNCPHASKLKLINGFCASRKRVTVELMLAHPLISRQILFFNFTFHQANRVHVSSLLNIFWYQFCMRQLFYASCIRDALF